MNIVIVDDQASARTMLRHIIESHVIARHEEAGFDFVHTPEISKGGLFHTSGHLPYYADTMFPPMLADEEHAERFRREAQKRLAWEVTALAHGEETTTKVIEASHAVFGGGDLTTVDPDTLTAVLAELPQADRTQWEGEPGTVTAVELLVSTGLVASRSEARRTVRDGGAFAERMGRVVCWNSVMDQDRYMVQKWNEFIAA